MDQIKDSPAYQRYEAWRELQPIDTFNHPLIPLVVLGKWWVRLIDAARYLGITPLECHRRVRAGEFETKNYLATTFINGETLDRPRT